MATAKQATTGTKKTRAPRKVLTVAELKTKLEEAKAAVAALEQKAYAGELEEAVAATKIVADFKVIKERCKGASDVSILTAIGKAAGVKRLVITQTEPVKRKKVSKPK